jgi:pimeloyl-ACP methyl ester carboxylesterase
VRPVTASFAASRPVRVDTNTGITERAGWDEHGVFSVLHEPPGDPVSEVLVCSPMLAEFQRNYRREVVLARRLAADGFRVRRFHYRGTGNSGDPGGGTHLGTATEDTIRLASEMGSPALVATRAGALAAAAAWTTGATGGPIVLWEPVVRGERFVDEILRASAVGGVAAGTTVDPAAVLVTQGWVDALGETLSAVMADSLRGAELSVAGLRRSLICHVGRADRPRRELSDLVERARSEGADVSMVAVEGREVWWANPGGDDVHRATEHDEVTQGLVEATARWLRGTA